MGVQTDSSSNGFAILFQIVGALLVIAVAVIAAGLMFHLVTAALGKLLPLLVIGAVLYVLLRLVWDAGRESEA
jgi:hypothetical protein